MSGPERVERSTTRFSPFGNIVFDPHGIPPSKKDEKNDGNNSPQPPRPQNAWILYRAWALGRLLERQPELKGTPQSQISRILASQWANETAEIRSHFEQQANLNKERHAQRFPNYVFRPQKKEDKEKEREKRKQERARIREAEKLKREVEKSMRAGYLPATMNSLSTPFVLHQLALVQFRDDASPPISQCPSPDSSSVDSRLPSEDLLDPAEESTTDADLPEASMSLSCAPTLSTSEDPPSETAGGADQQSIPFPPSTKAPCQPDSSMAMDASVVPDFFSDVSFDWSQFASGSMDDIDAFIKQAFPAGVPGPEPNRFEMPSGNLITSPGFVDDVQRSGNFDASGLISVPLGNAVGMLDEQYDCDLTNPHAESTFSSNAKDSATEPANEAGFMGPFVRYDASLEHLLRAGKEVGNALLDEQEASANGERVIAAEHVQDGASAAPVAKPCASSFLPSPPESSSSATSSLLFDFGSATNLSASCSDQRRFSDLGLSDSMSNSDMGSSGWSLSAFSDFGGPDNFGFGSSNDAPSDSSKNVEKIGSAFQGGGVFSSVPLTPVSAGPRTGSVFELGDVSMTDFSSISNAVSFTDEARAEKEMSWLASYFDESGSGPV